MKKMIFAAVVAAITLVACTSEINRECYHVSFIMPEQPEQVDSTGAVVREAVPETAFDGYKWASETEIVSFRNEWENMGYTNVFTEKVTERGETPIKTMADCLAN